MTADAGNVLIVDDEPNVRLVFRTALESSGYAVSEADDGEAALELLRRRRFGAALLDLRMPRLDGMGTLRRLRDEGIAVPVVVVTAHGNIPDVVAALRLGAVDFIPKPLSPETLRRVVAAALAGDRRPAAPPGPDPAPAGRLARESLARAERAVGEGEPDEADFFLRVAIPLGAEAAAARRVADDIDDLRRRRGVGPYRVLGRLTWG